MVRVKDPIPGVVYMSDADIGHYISQGVFTNQTLIGACRETFSRHAGRVALSGPTRTMSYAEFDARTTRGAAALWRLGLRPTDRALFQIRNSPELVQAFFSCLKIGVIPICTLPAHREQEITYIGNHAAAKLLSARERGTDGSGHFIGLTKIAMPARDGNHGAGWINAWSGDDTFVNRLFKSEGRPP